jgi:spermidine dehydrogenase
VLACYNMVIPYLCPELPERQKKALHYASKIPLIYVSVALRNWQAFKALGVAQIHTPGSYFSSLALNEVVDIGSYASARSPDKPVLLHLERVPVAPGLPEREQHRIGRRDVLTTGFETYERNIRDQLDRMLGPGGFDADATSPPSRSIAGRTATPTNTTRCSIRTGRRAKRRMKSAARFGSITIANADSSAAAYTDSAIDQAHRAVEKNCFRA